MEFSTKDVHGAHDHLVRRHGEGLKLAVQVLSLDSYNVSITAGGSGSVGGLLVDVF
jgi:hypothetical protein